MGLIYPSSSRRTLPQRPCNARGDDPKKQVHGAVKPSCPSVSLEARPTISRATLSLSGEMKPEASSIDEKDSSYSTHDGRLVRFR